MVRHRAVGRVRKSPVAQPRLGAVGTSARVTGRKEPVQHQPLDLITPHRRRLRARHQAGTPVRQRHAEPFLRRTGLRKNLLLQVTA